VCIAKTIFKTNIKALAKNEGEKFDKVWHHKLPWPKFQCDYNLPLDWRYLSFFFQNHCCVIFVFIIPLLKKYLSKIYEYCE
jgi:hypothetical protein